MPEYDVSGVEKKAIRKTYEVNSARAAAKAFRAEYGFWPECVDSANGEEYTYATYCEACDQAIFEGEFVGNGGEGIDLCQDCYDNCIEDAANQEDEGAANV